MSGHDPHPLQVGDRVTAILWGESRTGTVVEFGPWGGTPWVQWDRTPGAPVRAPQWTFRESLTRIRGAS